MQDKHRDLFSNLNFKNHQSSKYNTQGNRIMVVAAIVNDQTQTTGEGTVCSTSPAPSNPTSGIGFLGRWGRRIPVAPSIVPPITRTAVNSATTSTMDTPCAESCERCEELKVQSDINQSMLNDCATDLTIKEAEAEAVRGMAKKLQSQLDQADIKLRLEQARFDRELQLKDKQLAAQVAESKLLMNTSKELAAQLTKQHRELNEAHVHENQQVDVMKASHARELASFEAKLEAKNQEIVSFRAKLKEQEAAGDKYKAESIDKITQLNDKMCRLEQDIKTEAAKQAAELQVEYEKRVTGDLESCRARIAYLAAENEKLYTQLSSEDDLINGDNLSNEEEFGGDGVAV